MWTLKSKSIRRLTAAEVQAQKLPPGRLLQVELTLTFTDGTDDVTVSTFVSTKDEAKKAINQNLSRLNDQAELETEVQNDTLDLSEPAPEEPTAEELARKEWQDDWGKLQKVKPLIDHGVLTGNETPLVNLKNKVKTNFKVEYLDLI